MPSQLATGGDRGGFAADILGAAVHLSERQVSASLDHLALQADKRSLVGPKHNA